MQPLQSTTLSPGSVIHTPDGTEVRTLRGELAWQLGRAMDYGMMAEDALFGKQGLPGRSLEAQHISIPACIDAPKQADHTVVAVSWLASRIGTSEV
jgi:hypothetical protein